MELLRGGILRPAAPLGAVVRVERGEVWITQYPDPTDYLLRSGEAMRLERPGATVISALKDSQVQLAAPPQRATWWSGLRGMLALRPGFGA